MKRKKFRFSNIAAVLPMYIFTVAFILGPILYMLALSVFSKDGFSVRPDFTLRNFARIGEGVYFRTFLQSTKLALITTALCIAVGYPFAWFMATLPKRFRGAALIALILPFWTSSVMRLRGWETIFQANGPLDDVLIALGIAKAPLGLLGSYPTIVFGMVYALLPFMIYSVYTSAEKLDRRLLEASRDLGAGSVRAFLTVGFPLTIPGLFSGIILTFVPSMGLYFVADILGGGKTLLVGTLINNAKTQMFDKPFAAALSVTLLAITSLFMFAYRKLTGTDELEGLA
ncbi:MAG: ABC transporter permease [Oscillospiraceae bacterium]|jgi:spermidine/putrescine transport system permease protein|nr:ABC transporter permease [Oscillospiraceae bacterium]